MQNSYVIYSVILYIYFYKFITIVYILRKGNINFFLKTKIFKCISVSLTNLDASGEFVIAVNMDGGEFPDFVELELDLDRLAAAIVPPANPALGAIVIVVHFEIIRPLLAVRQLTQATAQLAVPVPVVDRVEEFPSIAPFIALGHRVGHHAVCGRKSQDAIVDPPIDDTVFDLFENRSYLTLLISLRQT